MKLGSLYDPSLASFASDFSAWIRATFDLGLQIDSAAVVNLFPANVARSVVGHLLAAEDRRDPVQALSRTRMIVQMRDYFLRVDGAERSFRIFVWPFVSDELIVARGFGISRVFKQIVGPFVGDTLKFYPFAFWVVANVPENAEIEFAELELDQESLAEIAIPLTRIPPGRWPEVPNEDEISVHSAERGHYVKRKPGAT